MNNYAAQIEAISKLLERRARVYPARDSSYTQLQSTLRVFADALLADIDAQNYVYDEVAIARASQLADAPVFICGSMKSGTTLLVQLLDHHPNLLVLPGDSHFLRVKAQWDRTQFREIASYWVSRIVNPTGLEPFWLLGQDESTFRTFLGYLQYFLRTSTRDAFVCTVMALHVARSRSSGTSREQYWVEKTPHNELHVRRLVQLFPQSRFIHVLRNPIDNIVSLNRLYAHRGWEGTVRDHSRRIRMLFKAAHTNCQMIGSTRYLIVRYEDITGNPTRAMRQVCEFLEIPFDPVLLVPTQNGRPAVANSLIPEARVKGKILQRDNNAACLNELNAKDIQTIVSTLFDEAVRVGYRWDVGDIASFRKTGVAYILHALTVTISDFAQRARARWRRAMRSRRTAVGGGGRAGNGRS